MTRTQAFPISLRFAVLVVVMFCLFITSLLFFWSHGFSGLAMNSDLVQPYLVTEDLLSAPSAFFTWRHSPSPYVFPDMLIAGVLVSLPLAPGWMMVLYGTALLTGYALSAGWILSRATETGYRGSILVFVGCLLSLTVAAALLPGSGRALSLLLMLFAPFIHTGAVFSALLALVLLERVLRIPGSPLTSVLLVLLVLVSSFSDALFAAWFVLPALLVLWLKARATRGAVPFMLMAVLFLATAASIAAERIFHGIKAGNPLRLDTILGSADMVWNDVASAAATPDWILIVLLVAIGAICITGARAIRRSFQRRQMPFSDALAVFMAASVLFGLLAPIVTSTYEMDAHLRYLVFLPLLAILKIALALSRALSAGRVVQALPVLLISAVFLATVPTAFSTAKTLGNRTELETCLAGRGLDTGLSSYWWAKHLIFLSDRRIHLVQIKPDGDRDKYNYNRAWFERRADDKSPILPDFILMTGLNGDSIEERFGPPADIVRCAGKAVWVYDGLTLP